MRIKLIIIQCIIYCILSQIILSQNRQIDSLYQIIKNKGNHDTIKIDAYYKVYNLYKQKQNNDSALNTTLRSLKITQNNPNSKRHIRNLLSVAIIQTRQNKDLESITLLDSILLMPSINNFLELKYTALNAISNAYRGISNYSKSLEASFESLKIADQLNDQNKRGMAFGTIGESYRTLQKYDKALTYQNKALEIFEKTKDIKSQSSSLNNLSIIYRELNQNEKAKATLLRVIKLKHLLHDDFGLGLGYNNLGNCYYGVKDYELAIVYYQKSFEIFKRTKNNYGISLATSNIGSAYFHIGNNVKSIEYCLESYRSAHDIKDLHLISSSAAFLTKNYMVLNNGKQAAFYFEELIKTNDTLTKLNLQKSNEEYQLKYTYEKKIATDSIKNLQESIIKNIELSQKSVKLNQQKVITYFIIGGLLIVSFLAFYIFKGLKKQRKANEIISLQKQEVERQKQKVDEHQKEILDSIHYASRIQKALLPNDKYIEKNIKKIKKI